MYCKVKEEDALVDMTLCVPTKCNRKAECWRYTHDSKNVWWQSYSDLSLQGMPKACVNKKHMQDCDFFIQNDPQDRDRRK